MSWVGDETELPSLTAGSPPSPSPPTLPWPPTSGAHCTPLASPPPVSLTHISLPPAQIPVPHSYVPSPPVPLLPAPGFPPPPQTSFYSSDLLLCLSPPQAIQTATYQCSSSSEKVLISTVVSCSQILILIKHISHYPPSSCEARWRQRSPNKRSGCNQWFDPSFNWLVPYHPFFDYLVHHLVNHLVNHLVSISFNWLVPSPLSESPTDMNVGRGTRLPFPPFFDHPVDHLVSIQSHVIKWYHQVSPCSL